MYREVVKEMLLFQEKISILFWPQFLRGRLLLFIVTIFLLLIGQNSRKLCINLGSDWFIQLSDNQRPIIAFCYQTLYSK